MKEPKEQKTNVMRILEQANIAYTPYFYDETTVPSGKSDYGVHVAELLGLDPEASFKTLVAQGASKNYYVYEVPVGDSLDLKKAAKAVGEKSIELLPMAKLQSVTGYIRGGCSPVGMKKQFTTVFHETAQLYDAIDVSAGKIGASVEVNPEDLIGLIGGSYADIVV